MCIFLESPVSQELENTQIKLNYVMSWYKMAPENEKKAFSPWVILVPLQAILGLGVTYFGLIYVFLNL
jgi:hypothetical protein